ncbi:Aste57867_19025 [Aphanomyces stellatus]|uniref:Aste57867_19025 protein n=1 Tax=Aphanomyces stellatus TaxID=120398 RepID=A0A485LD91_9STRA|nr:hypothetical protein As57867_018961 [Aphanomyces stellatus]VFT95750.1 Aste57867_19025 [Aphanomyces stellatus]
MIRLVEPTGTNQNAASAAAKTLLEKLQDAMAGPKHKKQDKKPIAKKKVHAKPAAKKGQPFASLSKHNKPQQAKKGPVQAVLAATHKPKHHAKPTNKHGSKELEAKRHQKLIEQQNFEERMRAKKQPPQPRPAPAFIMAPATFTFPSAAAPTPMQQQQSAFNAFMDPLLTKDPPVAAPTGPRTQPKINRPTNAFAVLDDDDAPAAAPFPMQAPTFQIAPPSFQMAPPTFQMAPPSFHVAQPTPSAFQMQLPPPVAAAAADDDDDL